MDYISALNIFTSLLIFFLALSVGSFLNVVIYRLPRVGLSVSEPKRSFCPACDSFIHWYDNIPVLSWLLLKARCRACGQPISFRYPLVELISGFLALYLYHRFGLSLSLLFYFYFVMCLLAIALIDLELMIIPNILVYPAIVAGLAIAAIEPSVAPTGPMLWLWLEPQLGPHLTALTGSALGAFLGWSTLWLISKAYKISRGHEGMGDGDPTLLAMIGAFLGWRAIPVVILGSSLIGLLSVGVMMLLAKGPAPEEGWGLKAIPFGPFLVLAAWLYLFFGPSLIAWYWSISF